MNINFPRLYFCRTRVIETEGEREKNFTMTFYDVVPRAICLRIVIQNPWLKQFALHVINLNLEFVGPAKRRHVTAAAAAATEKL